MAGADAQEKAASEDRSSSVTQNNSTEDLEAKAGSSQEGSQQIREKNLVEFSENDPDNPQNWAFRRKLWCTGVWIMGNLTNAIASSIFSSGSTLVQEEFGVPTVLTTLGLSLFLLGYAAGPIMFGPLSEKFGRKPPLLAGMIFFTCFTLLVTLGKNIQTILVGRFLQGLFGVAPMAIFGGGLVDLWSPVQRGLAMTGTVGILFGSPLVGNVMGNWVAERIGWRWDNWLSGIMGLCYIFIVTFTFPETHAPTILRRKAAKIRKETGNPDAKCKYDDEETNFQTVVRIYLKRPLLMLVTEPILLFFTIYQSFVYGLIYLLFVSFPIAFREVRHWGLGMSGLPYLGVFVGVVIGAAAMLYYTKTVIAAKVKKQNGVLIPEQRLPIMAVGGCLIPIGLFIFAWTSDPSIPWPGMVVGSIPIGTGMYLVFVCCFNYIVDVYQQIANSAVAGNTVIRSSFGFGFPLFGPAMYHKLGVDWATTLLAFLAVAMIPIPIVFYKYGAKIRSWSKNAVSSD